MIGHLVGAPALRPVGPQAHRYYYYYGQFSKCHGCTNLPEAIPTRTL